MPTNKLWIEHTERAAWDSVEALRERLSKAESRLQALAPNVDRLPQLLDALEQAKQQLATDTSPPDEVIAAMLSRIALLQAELNASPAATPTVVDFSVPVIRARLESEDFDGEGLERADEEPDLEEFTRAMRRHEREAGATLPRDLNRLLAVAETKLDDLTELEGGALREAALELALVAARIHAASRAKP